jgi:hypothetical protein
MNERITLYRKTGRIHGRAIHGFLLSTLEIEMIHAGASGNPKIPAGPFAPHLANGFESENVPDFLKPGSRYEHAFDFAAEQALDVDFSTLPF